MQRRVLFLVSLITQISLEFLLMQVSPVLAASRSKHVCNEASKPGYARCFSSVQTDASGLIPLATAQPQGYGPATFKAAYGDRGSSTLTIGVVGAFDAPNIVKDVATYSRTYGLPVPLPCTSATQTGCLQKYSQSGSSQLPISNSSWEVETSLDVEIVHAMCPGCRLDLVEASSPSIPNLAAAANQAAALGAKVISNSYGGPESSAEARYDSAYNHHGIAMVVSSGDSGYGTNYPAASPSVIAVGGTSLTMSGSRVVSETAWDGAGSGCSQFEYKPTWQTDKRCVMRSVADVAADADPATGAAIYDSYPNEGHSGWYTVGGTSLAAPLVAGILANAGLTVNQPAWLYANDSSVIRDIVGGSNGNCSLSYLCHANAGYDGPTGLGVLSHL